jgi:hypothetical protein
LFRADLTSGVPMPESVSLAPDGSHIRVVSTGTPQLKDLEQSLNELIRLHAVHGLREVLVDARGLTEYLPTGSAFAGAEMLAAMTRNRLRIAVLVSAVNDDTKFFENAATNRGAVIRFAESEPDAQQWLASLREHDNP